MAETKTGAWMWPTNSGGVNGVNLDGYDGEITWFDEAAACACGDSTAVQSFAQFLQQGAPLSGVPQDVLDALHALIQRLA